MAIQIWNPGSFVATGDPSTVDEATPFQPGQLGTVVAVKHSTLFSVGSAPRVFQYILRDATDGTTLVTNGGVAHWVDYDAFSVTQDESEQLGGTGAWHQAGVFFAAKPTVAQYGFIQVAGIGPLRLIDAPTAAASTLGLPCIPSTTDGRADVIADWNDSGQKPFAKTLSAKDAGSIGTHVIEALLFPDRNGW